MFIVQSNALVAETTGNIRPELIKLSRSLSLEFVSILINTTTYHVIRQIMRLDKERIDRDFNALMHAYIRINKYPRTEF